MNRREFLQCASILVAGASSSRIAFSLNQEQQVYLAAAPDYIALEPGLFTSAQRAVVAAMTEVIIPRTDTPGAIDAGAPRFVELMVQDWLNEEERAEFMRGLADAMARAESKYGASFDALDDDQQLALMEELEAEVADHPWYELGIAAMRAYIDDAPFLCQIKELTIWGFFTSEVGSTQVLRYDPMPMGFNPDLPLSDEDSTWAGGML